MSLSTRLKQRIGWEPPALMPFNALNAAVTRVLNRWPNVVPEPPEEDREALVQAMKARIESDKWEGALMSFAIAAARATFDERRRGRPDLRNLRKFYVEEINASESAAFLSGMAEIYVGSYVPGATHTRNLAKALRDSRDRIGGRWQDLFRRIPDCLDPDNAPDSLAKLMVNMADPWSELKLLGIRQPHAPGLMDHAHLAYVKLILPHLKQKVVLDKLFGWLRPPGQNARTSGAPEAIAAILNPWISENPKEELSIYITQKLVGAYDDPRTTDAVWSSVAPKSRGVIIRWLTGQNIEFLFKVVGEVELGHPRGHLYPPRKEFWLQLYEEKVIESAWVAFSEKAAIVARRRLKGTDAERTFSFGNQTEMGRNRKDTSLLILKTKNHIIVEGSHDYKVHIFRDGSPRTPKLYLPSYNCEDLRLIQNYPRGFHEDHVHDTHGNWQWWVRNQLRL